MALNNLSGAIVPDLPPEEGGEYLAVMAQHGLSPILLYTPTTSDERMKHLASQAKGFIYCVARKGVTGAETRFSEELSAYLARCRRATNLPLALGFRIKGKVDIDFIKGRAQIAVVGSEALWIVDQKGIRVVRDFIRKLHQ